MPEQALEEIRSEFLEKKHLGVDPVLFNIFVDFLKTSGVVIDPAFISRVKI